MVFMYGRVVTVLWFVSRRANRSQDNLRYSVDVCLYGFPNAPTAKTVSSPCDIDFACRPLKKSLEAGNLNPGNGTQFDYCTADGGSFSGTQLQDCIQCFRSSSNQFYMSNCTTLTFTQNFHGTLTDLTSSHCTTGRM